MLRVWMLVWAALALAATGCTVNVTSTPVGTASEDGSVYLGFTLVNHKGGKDWFLVGQEHGYFKTLRLHVENRPLQIDRMVVQFGNGETWSPPMPRELAADSWSDELALPGPRLIEKVTFHSRARGKKSRMAKVEVYGRR